MDAPDPTTWWIAFLFGSVTLLLLVALIAGLVWQHRQSVRIEQEWSRRLLESQEAERRRVAAELHDEVLTRLWNIREQIGPLQATTAFTMIAAVMDEVRDLSKRIYPPLPTGRDLGGLLIDLARQETRDIGSMESDPPWIEVEVADHPALPEAVQVVLYRVAQEAVANARRHAKAAEIRVTLSATDGRVTLTVTDDGIGIAPHPQGNGIGLRTMRERLRAVGGTFSIGRGPKGGTAVTARVPTAERQAGS